MPCSKVSINKNYKCDKATCICIPTDGKPCICICENENGDITRCDDCKCNSSGGCQCKCDDSKCTCIVTKGASCICVCCDERGNLKSCDCSCFEANEAISCCKKEISRKSCTCCGTNQEKSTRGNNCACGSENLQIQRRDVEASKSYSNRGGCICIPTGRKPCICIYENENGDFIRCDDCKCRSDRCQCKCDDARCACIITNGASCICVCRDERGNIKACDCSGTGLVEPKSCCKRGFSMNSRNCCNKKQKEETCDVYCKCNGKQISQIERRDVEISKSYSNKGGCVCIPTDGKPCICICENENGDFIRCDDCKCRSDSCQCKCDDARCTCIITNGASCICVCRDERGNIKACDCSGTGLVEPKSCCKRGFSMNSRNCCNKKQKERTCDICCNCNGKQISQIERRDVEISKSYSNKGGCVCIPTDGKPCICICENENGDITRCDDCKCNSSGACQPKCDDSKCTCIVTKGSSCICVCRDERGNLKSCDCSCFEVNEATSCCKKQISRKSCTCCGTKQEKSTRGNNCACGSENFQTQRWDVELSKSYSNKGGCVCLPTDGKPSICICENKNGDFIRCDDCKCRSDNCQCKCNDARCTCIITNGASCICVCRGEMGHIKACDCSTGLAEAKPCCMKEVFERPCKCYDKKPEESNCGNYCCTVAARPASLTCKNSCICPTKSTDCKYVDNKSYNRISCICVSKRNTLIDPADNDDSNCTVNRKIRFSVCCDQDNLRRCTVEPNECCTAKTPGNRCACFVSDGRRTCTSMPCYRSGTGSNKKTDGKCCGCYRN